MHRVAITGAAGRMGRTLVQALNEADGLQLGAALEQPGLSLLGSDAGEVAGVGRLGIPLTADIGSITDQFATIIDFTVPAATLALLPTLVERRKTLVLGTTGFDADGLAALRKAADHIAIMHAPNMSVGVNLCFKLIEMAARALGDDVDIEVIEAHHKDKIDSPSGTALRMGEILAATLERDLDEVAVYGREGITGARDRKTIGFETLRAGDIVGEHTVMFAGQGERIEITHRASSRMNFAQGALRAVRFLAERPAGLYDMQDVLGLVD